MFKNHAYDSDLPERTKKMIGWSIAFTIHCCMAGKVLSRLRLF